MESSHRGLQRVASFQPFRSGANRRHRASWVGTAEQFARAWVFFFWARGTLGLNVLRTLSIKKYQIFFSLFSVLWIREICCHTFFWSHKFHKIENNIIFEMLKKRNRANFHRIIELFDQKIVTKLSKIWVWDPGSEIRDPEKTYSVNQRWSGFV